MSIPRSSLAQANIRDRSPISLLIFRQKQISAHGIGLGLTRRATGMLWAFAHFL